MIKLIINSLTWFIVKDVLIGEDLVEGHSDGDHSDEGDLTSMEWSNRSVYSMQTL